MAATRTHIVSLLVVNVETVTHLIVRILVLLVDRPLQEGAEDRGRTPGQTRPVVIIDRFELASDLLRLLLIKDTTSTATIIDSFNRVRRHLFVVLEFYNASRPFNS